MATDRDRERRLKRECSAASRALPCIQRDTDAEVRRLLRQARRDIQAAIAEAAPGGFTALSLRSLERSVNEALAAFGQGAGTAAAAGQQRAWEAGIDTVDRPLSAALSPGATPFDLSAVLPEVDTEQLRAMRETTEDIEIWRGRKIDYAVGETIEEKAFGSWSTSYRTAANFAGGVTRQAEGTLYRLRLPKGNRAVVENELEQEVLLAPDTRYRVAEIVDNADKGADRIYRGSSRVYILEVVKDVDGAG